MYENELEHTQLSWAYDVLESDQLSSSKLQFKRRPISRKLSLLLWVLRLYAVAMLILVVIQIATHFNS